MLKKLTAIFIALLILAGCATPAPPETPPPGDYNDYNDTYEIPAPDYDPDEEIPPETQDEDDFIEESPPETPNENHAEVALSSDTLTPTNFEFGHIPGDELSDEQIAEMTKHMVQFGNYLLQNYLVWANDPPVDRDNPISVEGIGERLYRVATFSTIQEIKDATESVFSLRASEHIYSRHRLRSEWPSFFEIDGALYFRSNGMGGGPPYHPAITSVISKDPDRIVVMTYMWMGPDSTLAPADLALIRERGRWVFEDPLLQFHLR